MSLFAAVRPLIFTLDPERAHELSIAALKRAPARKAPPSPARLAIEVAGVHFPNPVGLAAGYDKSAEVPDPLLRLGFGFVEVGTLTPLPQPGNPRPRLFRLAADRAVLNRLGFNNRGQADAVLRLQERPIGPSTSLRTGVVGINLGANKDSADRVADYAAGAQLMAELADYLTVNISSPNTPGLRQLQDAGALRELLAAVRGASGATPLFLKVAPDLEPADVDAIAREALDGGVAALIISNTTVSRPPLRSPGRGERGGLSGAPLGPLALQRLRDFRAATGGALALVAVGGIGSGADAYARIRAGASLVQLYTAMIYEGPGIARRIVRELDETLERDGFVRVSDAVGADA